MRFFIDVADETTVHRDVVGSEVPAFKDARTEALSALADLLRLRLPSSDEARIEVSIRDEAGQVVYEGVASFKGSRGTAVEH